MFERFTTSAREAVIRARGEAIALGHGEIGPEHVLLAMLDDQSGAAVPLATTGIDHAHVRAEVARLALAPPEPLGPQDAEALRTIGVDLDAVLGRITESFGADALREVRQPARKGLLRRKSRGSARTPPFSARGKKVLEFAVREAVALHGGSITAEHLLLGLLREGGGAVTVLTGLGVDVEQLRATTVDGLRKAA